MKNERKNEFIREIESSESRSDSFKKYSKWRNISLVAALMTAIPVIASPYLGDAKIMPTLVFITMVNMLLSYRFDMMSKLIQAVEFIKRDAESAGQSGEDKN